MRLDQEILMRASRVNNSAKGLVHIKAFLGVHRMQYVMTTHHAAIVGHSAVSHDITITCKLHGI